MIPTILILSVIWGFLANLLINYKLEWKPMQLPLTVKEQVWEDEHLFI